MINIALGDDNITVPVVIRDFAGVVIHLSVSNKIGSDDSGNFKLNVQCEFISEVHKLYIFYMAEYAGMMYH